MVTKTAHRTLDDLALIGQLPAAAGVAERALALVYADQGQLPQALDHLHSWQRLAPNDAEPHRALAQVYLQLTRIPDALTEQTLVVQLNPTSASDWNDLGVMAIWGVAGVLIALRRWQWAPRRG